MDLDQFIATRRPEWERLERLARTARRGPRRLAAGELDELVACYQRVTADLAHARTAYDDASLIARLSDVVGSARGAIYQRRSRPGPAVARFVTVTFPTAMWRCRTQIAIAAFLMLVPALVIGVWLAGAPSARSVLIPTEAQELLAGRDFEEYYRSEAAASFQTRVTVNNIQVAVMAFVGGILAGVPTVVVLLANAQNLGVAAAVLHAYGEGAQFWGLVTPHGLLEITAILVAAGAGLRLGWAVIAPGERTRGVAVAEEGALAVVLVIGVTACFVVAGFVEAWVTPSALPTAARVAIGVLLEVAFLLYAFGLGRAAAASEPADRLDPEVRVGQ